MLEQLAAEPDLRLAALVTDPASVPSGVAPVRIRRIGPGRFSELEHELRLPFDIRNGDFDVFHSPGNSPPARCRRPWVQTLHDLIPLAFDDPGFRDERRRWQRRGGRIRNAAAILADSQYTADQAIGLLGLDPRRVHVAHLGCDARFHPPAAPAEPAEPYVLYVGEYGPHKGYAEAFAAVGALADRGHPHRLKMVSRMTPVVEQTVRTMVTSSAHPERIDLLGFVSDDDLVALYHGAAALMVTSRAEGFGLPALEAMASGTPVVSFRNTSLTEVVGEGGVLVADGDVPGLVAEVAAIISNQRRAEEVSASGVAHAARFTWQSCAAVHAAVFRDAASR